MKTASARLGTTWIPNVFLHVVVKSTTSSMILSVPCSSFRKRSCNCYRSFSQVGWGMEGWCIFKKTKLCSTFFSSFFRHDEGTPLPMASWEASNLRAFSGSYPSWRQSSAMRKLVVWCVYIGDAGTMRGSRTGSFWWNWGGGLKRSFSEMAESEKRNIPKNLLEGRKTYFQTAKMEWCTPRSPVYSYIIDFPAG